MRAERDRDAATGICFPGVLAPMGSREAGAWRETRTDGGWREGCRERGARRGRSLPAGAEPGRLPGRGRALAAGTVPWPRPPRALPGCARPSWREVTERLREEVTRVACGPGAVWGGLGQDGRIHRSVRGGSLGPGERRAGLLLGKRPHKGLGRVSFRRDGGGRALPDGRDPSGEELSSDRGERETAGAPGQIITESQVQFGWKRPLRSSSPTYDRAPPCQLDHSTECHVQSFLKHLQGR